MTEQNEQLLSDIVAALSIAMVEFCRSIERQQPGNFSRQPVIAAIQDAAAKIPINSENSRTTKAILANIAVYLEGGDQQPNRLPFGKEHL